jgi:NAD+ kinase
VATLGSDRQHRIGDRVQVRRVVLVRKTTAVEALAEHADRKLARALAGHEAIAERVQLAHDEHVASVATVEECLRRHRVEVRAVRHFDRRLAAWADLVVTVGGDGTFLRASHSVDEGARGDGVPMVGVNSAASSSVGWFCAATAAEFPRIFSEIAAGALRTHGLWRMRVALNGKPLRDLALNDVLLAHRIPAETSRYLIDTGEVRQDQKSSGIWIATAAGSTAAIRSAGGEVLDIGARTLQFRVRELMAWAVQGEPVVGGRCEPGGSLTVVSRMSTGTLYLDGNHRRQAFGFGDRIAFRCSDRPLPWIAPAGLEGLRAGERPHQQV